MTLEDFRTYDETDGGTNITVAQNTVSWVNLDRDETSHVSKSYGVDFFNEDFEHKFVCNYFNIDSITCYFCFWQLANAQLNLKALMDDAGEDGAAFFQFNDKFYLRVVEGAGTTDDVTLAMAEGINHFITLARDDDGGANNTGQYTAEIRTGSHTGVLVDTLTVDCAVGEQNDFQYVFALASYNDGVADETADGRTQNLDLQMPGAGATGMMSTNTNYWGY